MHSDKEAKKASLAKDEYLVAVKLLLFDGAKLLVLKDQWGSWDIPGGRIRKDQFKTPLPEVLREKINVELGPNVQYKLGEIKTTLRLERQEIGRGGKKVRIFAVCYEGKYLGGSIAEGEYMPHHEWIDFASANLEGYSDGDSWVVKLKQYQQEFRSKND